MGKKAKVYVLCEQPRWGEEKFMHGVFTCDESLAKAMDIVINNHKAKGFAPPEFGVETVTLDEMPFDWIAYQESLDNES